MRTQNVGSLLMKLSQSNFNLRSPDCYLVRSYLIATVQKNHETSLNCEWNKIDNKFCIPVFELQNSINFIEQSDFQIICKKCAKLLGHSINQSVTQFADNAEWLGNFKITTELSQARTTDAQWGNRLHCTAENQTPNPKFLGTGYGQSIFCLPHRPKISDFFDLCLHWVPVVRGHKYILQGCTILWYGLGSSKILW